MDRLACADVATGRRCRQGFPAAACVVEPGFQFVSTAGCPTARCIRSSSESLVPSTHFQHEKSRSRLYQSKLQEHTTCELLLEEESFARARSQRLLFRSPSGRLYRCTKFRAVASQQVAQIPPRQIRPLISPRLSSRPRDRRAKRLASTEAPQI